MKSKIILKLILASFVMLGFSSGSFAQCVASFSTVNGSGAGVFYNNNSTMSGTVNNIYQWTFTGGTPASIWTFDINDSVYVSYPGPGTYTACLVVYDSLANCTDSICDTVVVTGTNPLSAGLSSTQASCGQCNGSLTASANGGVAPFTYLWSNASTSATISGLCPGSYSVTITDNNGATAAASTSILGSGSVTINLPATIDMCDTGSAACAYPSGGATPYSYLWSDGSTWNCIVAGASGTYTVTVTDANGCTATASTVVTVHPALTVSTTSNDVTCGTCCDGSASASAAGGSGGYSYSWSNGSTTASVSGLCSGWYYVTVTDNSTGCTGYGSVNIGNPCQNYIYGSVTPFSEATVYLVQESGGVLSLADSIDIGPQDTGMYFFGPLCSGTYYVKAALRPASSQYSNYIPTYYVNQALWGNATAIVPNGWVSADISLISGTNPGGPGFVGGLVSQGANRGEGDPVAGAEVILMDMNDEVIGFTETDANGEYNFDGVAYGEYKVLVDIINFDPYPFAVTVSEDEASFNEINFEVAGGMIRPVEEVDVVGIGSIESSDVSVFPNPVNDQLTVKGEGLTSIVLFNILGETVMNVSLSNTSQSDLSLGELSSGQYILKVESDSGVTHQTIIKE